MADKKKLTVAELLARDKKARGEKGGKDDKRSRRHRRSLDEGGISVAELTGNLKKVEASPAEAKHTSVSIDEDAPVIRAPKAADATDADSAKKSTDKPASQSAATTAAQPAAPKAAPKTAAKAEPKAAPKSADKPAAKAAAKPAQTAKPAAAAAAQEAAKKNQPSADDTAVIQRVGKAKADDAKPAAAKAAAAKPAAEKPAADKAGADKATAAKADKGAKVAGAGAATAGAGAAAAAAVPASKKAGVAKDAEETGNLPKVEDDEEWIEEEHEKLNPVSILLMIVAGILLAIVIFKGFEILWDSFPRLVVAILALCVTAIMVGVTHALRTARDGFSMFLAGFTGLILTFGPLLLVML
ncbi:tripartite tricarboxylate transporter TctB family protein [Corynebacterium marquesiae]|uniref:tripartite tricarboxylate transporter TctB family protein n=1 Tax=Corynebacterium marquesiae TaxID=2913503 RepID=UPI00254D56E8|nr:tripartite tricarboxylate transporter TctB family protein [Corynebacterium marquesiae]MDK8454680.1 tripartite tricarboxylate transporter TctB family protein [Corynebacterium marquesiae]MDK8481240.1 tripartite tricarboxylate transporter TctB family protein [Corynebacterium marquesiae]MDK8724799.1 tripartite tricarboxylate transporter TctB family protein [Corynebacterium marquesiae]MDK8770120.1 tripartite tricarboxylate transporter TctB family protein [Corynebacterium marquesiae]